MKMFLFVIFMLFEAQLEINMKFENPISNINEVKIKIRGSGNQTIIREYDGYFGRYPDEVYVGETLYENVKSTINLTENENIITFKWNSKITYCCFSMFSGYSNITEVVFTHFDDYEIIGASYMFWGCESLTSIDFGNFGTSKITTMYGMFSYCINLNNLNLSAFNTSSLEKMGEMFYNCSKLTSIDLSNFDTSKVTNMFLIFGYCE